MLPPFSYLFIMDLVAISKISYAEYLSHEPGCDISMMQAYIHAFQSSTQKVLDHDLIKKINKVSLSHLSNIPAGQYRDKVGSYPIYIYQNKNGRNDQYSGTQAGLLEFVNAWLMEDNAIHSIDFESSDSTQDTACLANMNGKTKFVNMAKSSVEDLDLNQHKSFILSASQQRCYKLVVGILAMQPQDKPDSNAKIIDHKMQRIINSFNQQIVHMRTDSEKITTIVKHVQLINQLHPFYDGNIRTCYILLNKLLYDYHLPLTLLLNPNRLDSCSLAEVVQMVKTGQSIYQQLLAHTSPDEPFVFQTCDPLLTMQTITCPLNLSVDSVLFDLFYDAVIKGQRALTYSNQKSLLFQRPRLGCEPPPGSYIDDHGKTIVPDSPLYRK